MSRPATALGLQLRRMRVMLAAALAFSALGACQGTLVEKGVPKQVAPPPVAGEATEPPVPAPVGPVTVEPGPGAAGAPPTAGGAPPSGEGGQQVVKVGLLLPLSGQSAPLGRAVLNAAELALFDSADKSVVLLPRDTEGTAEGAERAGRAVLAEGPKLILGPFFAAEVGAVAPLARAAGVNVVAFSTDERVAGQGVFLIGFLPRSQVARVVSYAHAQGIRRFAAVVPDSAYGNTMADLLRAAADVDGASVAAVATYDPAANNAADTVKRLDPTTFDAVMLPEGGERLLALAPLFPYYDIDPTQVRLLGTGLWDDPRLGKEPALIGGWYAAPDPHPRADFERRYTNLYGGGAPPRIATLGYDATALAVALAREPGGPDFSVRALTSPNGFAGLDGIFRLRADGLNERGLAVLEIQRNGPRVVSPAPTSFVGE